MNRIQNNFWIVFETGPKSPKEHYLFTVIKAQTYNLASRDKQITGDHGICEGRKETQESLCTFLSMIVSFTSVRGRFPYTADIEIKCNCIKLHT